MYQLDPKTVIRAGYGRSFDTGVFGSIFGHVVTQNLPVLADQAITVGRQHGLRVNLGPGSDPCCGNGPAGTPAYVFPTVPSNGLASGAGLAVSVKTRPNPLRFPTIDAWNLAVAARLTPTMALTVAYVGTKGTHNLGDGDNNNTNPNEAALFLPGSYSVTGQTLNWDPNGPKAEHSAGRLFRRGLELASSCNRYYGGSLASLQGLQLHHVEQPATRRDNGVEPS